MFDEAGSITLLSALIVWRGEIPIILIGDNKQLHPVIISSQTKYSNGKFVDAFYLQLELDLNIVLKKGWPFWLVPEQLRVEPGLWDLPNRLFYDSRIKMNPSVKISVKGQVWELFLTSSGGLSRISPANHQPAGYARLNKQQQLATIERTLPVMFNVVNGHTFIEANGTSRGNSYNIHWGCQKILEYVEFCENSPYPVQPGDIAIVTPFLKQVAMWREALAKVPKLRAL